MDNPLISITIPTYNSGKFLDSCLKAIKNQTYKNIEINIIDCFSKDNTIDIAKKNGIENIKLFNGALLAARNEGVRMSMGKYILLLDSDQILENTSLERAVERMEKLNYDMMILEEDVYRNTNFIEKLFYYDRKLVHAIKDFDPITSVMLPRFYKAELLRAAFANIPEKIISTTGGPDHAIIYYESWKLSQRIDLLPNAVRHIEPNSLKQIFWKFYRWGYTRGSVPSNQEYDHLMNKKERFRTGLFQKGMFMESLASILLLLLKGVPYKTGYFVGKLKRNLNHQQ